MARGSIRKRTDRYTIVYRVGGRQKWEVAGSTKKQAEELLSKRLSELDAGIMPEDRKILFAEFAARWLTDYARVSVKPSTYQSYSDIIRLHLLPAFGHLPLKSVTASHIQALVSRKIREDGLSPKSVVNMLVPLKELFKHAVQWGVLRYDPTVAVKRPRVTHEEMDFLTPSEIPVFLSCVRPAYHTLFMTAIFTGMRRGELLALQWGDIDWRSATVSIRRSLYKGTYVSPKSVNGTRRVMLSPVLKQHLETHRVLCHPDHELVFCTADGSPLDPDNLIKREFQPALARAGLRRIRFHDLRHTFASLLIANGENIKFVQQQLGHASAKTTLDRYGHLFPGGDVEAAARLDKAVFGAVSKVLADPKTDDSPTKKETSEVARTQRFSIGGGGRI